METITNKTWVKKKNKTSGNGRNGNGEFKAKRLKILEKMIPEIKRNTRDLRQEEAEFLDFLIQEREKIRAMEEKPKCPCNYDCADFKLIGDVHYCTNPADASGCFYNCIYDKIDFSENDEF